MPRQWKTESEYYQNLGRSYSFTYTLTADTAADAATIATRMSEGLKVSFVVELFDAYVRFDGTAATDGTDSMLIPAGTGYSEDNIFIETRISIINATAGNNARIRGCIWGR